MFTPLLSQVLSIPPSVLSVRGGVYPVFGGLWQRKRRIGRIAA